MSTPKLKHKFAIHKRHKDNVSNRDKMLKRTFAMYVNKGLYFSDEFHAFCHWAKGKTESRLIGEITCK